MESIGEKIYNLRKEKGVSQEELSFALGVSRQTISRWERDTVKPTVENLESLTKFFGVNSDYFLNEEVAAIKEDVKQFTASEEFAKKPKFKIWKKLIAVAVIVLLALGVVACGIATYVAAAPVQGQEVVSSNRFNNIGIICFAVGIILLALLTTSLILFIRDRIKK